MEENNSKSNCITIVLFGPESTGKTTLCQALAAHFNTTWAKEYTRTYLQDKWDKTNTTSVASDVEPIAIGQLENELYAQSKANKVVFLDTNLLEVKEYARYYFGDHVAKKVNPYLAKQEYHYYLLTNIDVPWQQDDLRDRPEDRQNMFINFENCLKKNNFRYEILQGDHPSRLKKAIQIVEGLLNKSAHANQK